MKLSDVERSALARRVGERAGRALVVGGDVDVLPGATHVDDLTAATGAFDTVAIIGAPPPVRALAARVRAGALVVLLVDDTLPPGYSWFEPVGTWKVGSRSLILLRPPAM